MPRYIRLSVFLALMELITGISLGAEDADYVPHNLFNGRDLAEWQPVGDNSAQNWTIQNGEIVCHGKAHCWLRSREQFGDFSLSLEYCLEAGANSGVYVHVPSDGNHHRENASSPSAGFEVQILDDRSPRYANLKDYQFSASLYDIVGARPRNSRPAGQWNSLKIACAADSVKIWHNGVIVVDADSARYPLLKMRRLSGHLGLQSHNGVVRFRKLRLDMPAARQSSAPTRSGG